MPDPTSDGAPNAAAERGPSATAEHDAPTPAAEGGVSIATLALVADGLRWGLGIVLAAQVFLGALAPTVLDVLVSAILVRRGALSAGVSDFALASAVPWAVYAGMHLFQARLLRRLGGFPFSDAQVAAMALVPGYNLYGAVALFEAQGSALRRLGAGARLPAMLRATAAVSVALALALTASTLRAYGPFLHSPTARLVVLGPGAAREIWILGTALLAARILTLAQVQIATRAALEARRGQAVAAIAVEPAMPGLPGASTSIAVAGGALLAGALALWPAAPPPPPPPAPARAAARASNVQVIGAVPPPQPGGAAAAPAPSPVRTAPPSPELPQDALFGGRQLAWWRERLAALRGAQDEPGRRLYAHTRGRAEANGFVVTEDGPAVRVEAGPEAIARKGR